MPQRDERMKASDVFNASTPFLGKTSSFSDAFPAIAELFVEVQEHGDHTPKWSSKTTYTHTNPPGECVNCSNSRCYNGGFGLAAMIRNIGYSKQTELQKTVHCQGYEGSPKGRKNDGPCDQYFEVVIRIVYKE